MLHGSSDFKRNLYGWFGVAYGKKSLEEIFVKYCASARNIFNYPRTKIFKQNPYQNAQQYVALQEGFLGDRLTARHLKQNLNENL